MKLSTKRKLGKSFASLLCVSLIGVQLSQATYASADIEYVWDKTNLYTEIQNSIQRDDLGYDAVEAFGEKNEDYLPAALGKTLTGESVLYELSPLMYGMRTFLLAEAGDHSEDDEYEPADGDSLIFYLKVDSGNKGKTADISLVNGEENKKEIGSVCLSPVEDPDELEPENGNGNVENQEPGDELKLEDKDTDVESGMNAGTEGSNAGTGDSNVENQEPDGATKSEDKGTDVELGNNAGTEGSNAGTEDGNAENQKTEDTQKSEDKGTDVESGSNEGTGDNGEEPEDSEDPGSDEGNEESTDEAIKSVEVTFSISGHYVPLLAESEGQSDEFILKIDDDLKRELKEAELVEKATEEATEKLSDTTI
jgi:hypothetical protein